MPSCLQTIEKPPFHRLPKSVIPKLYSLTLNPDLQKFTFDGTVVIDVNVVNSTNTTLLNALDL
ncbi:puromycin-sensitive aminopeptidase-like protein, partial [Leptotrombidium deliense]